MCREDSCHISSADRHRRITDAGQPSHPAPISISYRFSKSVKGITMLPVPTTPQWVRLTMASGRGESALLLPLGSAHVASAAESRPLFGPASHAGPSRYAHRHGGARSLAARHSQSKSPEHGLGTVRFDGPVTVSPTPPQRPPHPQRPTACCRPAVEPLPTAATGGVLRAAGSAVLRVLPYLAGRAITDTG